MDGSIGELFPQSVKRAMVSDLKGVVFPIIDDYSMIMVALPESNLFSMFLKINGKPTKQ